MSARLDHIARWEALRIADVRREANRLRAAIIDRRSPVTGGRLGFPGIVKDAEALGVNRIHLFLVLKGERESASLLRRYQELKQGGGK